MTVVRACTALACAASLVGSAAVAAPKGCVSEAEGAAIMASILPDLIVGLGEKCSAHLPATAFLATKGTALAGRYKLLADRRWPTAKLAFGRMMGEPDMAEKLPDEYFRPMLGSMVGAELIKDVSAEDCGGADRIVESLAPLPPENVADLIGAILMLADKDGSSKGFEICRT